VSHPTNDPTNPLHRLAWDLVIASLQATALLFRMFSLDELREMQARKDQDNG
jgi:hypothetical protein